MEISVMSCLDMGITRFGRYLHSFNIPEEWRKEDCILLTGIWISDEAVDAFHLKCYNLKIEGYSKFDEDTNVLSKFTVPVNIYRTESTTSVKCYADSKIDDLTVTFQWCSTTPEYERYNHTIENVVCCLSNRSSIHFALSPPNDVVYIKAFTTNDIDNEEDVADPVPARCIRLWDDDEEDSELIIVSPTVVRANGRIFSVTTLYGTDMWVIFEWLIVKASML